MTRNMCLNLFRNGRRSLFMVLFLSITGLFFFPRPCFANSIGPGMVVHWYLLLFSPLIEAVLVPLLLKMRFTQFNAWVRTFLLTLLMNIITLPLTVLLAGFLSQHFGAQAYYAAELFPLLAEYGLLYLLCAYLYRRHSIPEPASWAFILLTVLAANLLTFTLGLVFF